MDDHWEETNPDDRGHFYNSQGTHKSSRRYIYDSRHIICKWNIIFISPSRNITFTVASHLPDRKSITIFKAFKEIYIYYLKCGFKITTLHVDVEFAPLHALIHDIPGGPILNLASASEHANEI